VHLTYNYLIIASFIAALNNLGEATLIIATAAFILFICDQAHLINFKTFIYVDLDGSFESFVAALKADNALNQDLVFTDRYITFMPNNRKAIRKKKKIILGIKKNHQSNVSIKERFLTLLMLNSYLIFAVIALVLSQSLVK